MGQISYTTDELDNALRITYSPSVINTYLPVASPYTTPSLTSGVWTKLLLPTTAKTVTDFAIVDIGGSDLRYQYQGSATDPIFRVDMSSGVSASVNSTTIELAMSNGTIGVDADTLEVGVYAVGLAKTAGDISPLAITGRFHMETNDVIAVWIKVNTNCTVSFFGTSIRITETAEV